MSPYKGAFQSTTLGTAIRILSGNRLLKYHDEIEVPRRYTKEYIQRTLTRQQTAEHSSGEDNGPANHDGMVNEKAGQAGKEGKTTGKPTPRARSRSSSNTTVVAEDAPAEQPQQSKERSSEQEPSQSPENAEKGQDPNLVTWYGPDDPENPYNWSAGYKTFVALQMSFLTFSVYVGSAIYSAGIAGPNPDSVTNHFDVSQTSALVGLTTFVLGYGIGPMIWSPLTEFPAIGRLPVYVGTLIVFVGLQFPTIYAPNIQTLLAMRFFAGFFGSPCLAVGGATMGDMFRPKHLAYALGVWGCGAVSGPVFGPLLGGFAYQAKGWTWTIWILTWLSGACLVLIIMVFPETSSKNILHRRMMRLRKATGNQDLKTQGEIDNEGRTGGDIAKEILWRPFQLFFEPILLVYNTYLALLYGLLYLWFESFPIVFVETRGFNPGQQGLAFLGIFIGAWGACAVFCFYIYKYLGPIFDANDGIMPVPERRLYPAPIAAICIPIAMFGFGWSGQYESVHWIVPVIFTAFFGIGAFILFQTIFAYFGDVYNEEMGSVLTLNDLFRSTWGAAFPLFAHALFLRLGTGGGNSLLGGLACLFVPAPFLFIKYGAAIRKHSKYAKQDDLKN